VNDVSLENYMISQTISPSAEESLDSCQSVKMYGSVVVGTKGQVVSRAKFGDPSIFTQATLCVFLQSMAKPSV
jgi:hypothetical protein